MWQHSAPEWSGALCLTLEKFAMKKSLIALAVLAASGAAMAQSSVTLFGVVDASVARISNKGTGAVSNTGLANSGYNSSRIGFRGTEDLGGGLAASFWLEGALSNDDGNAAGLTFQRRSTVSLSGAFGEVRLGRDYVPTFWNDTVFDPFGTNGVGTNIITSGYTAATTTGTVGPLNNNLTAVRASNSIGYFLPRNLGGFYGQAMYAFDEAPSNVAGDPGRYIGGRVGYSAGPLNIALAAARRDGSDPLVAANPDNTTVNLGASYDFGFLQLMGELSRQNVDFGAGVERDLEGYLLGLTAPVGPGQVRFAWSRLKSDGAGADPRASKLALGYVYNLSKRTALYATAARVSNKDGANLSVATNGVAAGAPAVNNRSSGYEFGVRHSF
jgi:predicted porin